jgi:tetratricopeptide (TPR) repeat protein
MDFQSKPLPGVTLIIRHARGVQQKEASGITLGEKGGTGRTFMVKTDQNGNFVLSGLRTGVYSVTLRVPVKGTAEEREIYTKEVFVQNGLELEVEYNLQALMADELEAARKEAEELKKFEDMKSVYEAGVASLEQAKQAHAQMVRTPRDQRSHVQQQFDQHSQAAVARLERARDRAVESKDESLHVVLAELGEAYEVAGRPEDAVKSYERAIAAAPKELSSTDLAGYHNNLGNSLAKTGRIEEAGKAYEKSAQINPAGAAQAYLNFGIVLYGANQLTSAVTQLRRAVGLNPNHADAWYMLGASLLASMETRQQGDKTIFIAQPGTAEAFQKYLELVPNGRFANEAKAALQTLETLGSGVDNKYRR